jgi:hypothetical protein
VPDRSADRHRRRVPIERQRTPQPQGPGEVVFQQVSSGCDGSGGATGVASGGRGDAALALFDAFASKEQTLHANPGNHRTNRWVGIDQES